MNLHPKAAGFASPKATLVPGIGVIWTNASGQMHRDGDEPAFIGVNGDQEWFQDGRWHREGKPARILNGGKRREWHHKEHGLFGVEDDEKHPGKRHLPTGEFVEIP